MWEVRGIWTAANHWLDREGDADPRPSGRLNVPSIVNGFISTLNLALTLTRPLTRNMILFAYFNLPNMEADSTHFCVVE
jgi:hypothetical protein